MQDLSKNEEIIIRPMCAADEALVDAFFAAMGGEARAFFNRFDGNHQGTLKYLRDPKDSQRYWMAELDGQMAGYVFCWDWHTSIPWLGIAVREDLKGRHLGRKLLAFAQQQVKEAGKGGLQLTTHLANLRGQVLYETMGFKRIGIDNAFGEWYYLFRFED